MKIEVFHAAGCAACLRELPDLRSTAKAVDPDVEWHELDILRHIDQAVDLGVLKPPAVAIDGVLVFVTLPTAQALAIAMRSRSGG